MEQGWYNYRHSGNFGGLTPAYYENAYELIDNDGEFYLNSDEGYVYYKPRKNEDLTTAEVILPTVEKLLTVKGTPDNFVKNVSFANLTFAYTTWYYVNEPHGLTTVQNNILNPSEVNDQSYPTAEVNVSAADGVTFEKCRFKSLGINGLNMMSGINNCAVVGCEFGDISGAGMCFGDVANKCKNPVDERIMLKNNEITDNYFHDTPAEFQSSAALTIGFPTNARVANNEFFNTPYSAIHAAIGWQVLYSSVFKDIVFENNYFHEIDTSELYDSGAIYTLGGSGGDDENPIIIRGNYIKNKYRVGGAFYPDEGSSNYLLYDNVIDLRDVKSVDDHWEGDKQSWIFNNPAFSGNIIADNNYVTSEVTMTRANVLVTNTHAYPDADWCPEALDIIDNSGISDNYKYLFPDTLRLYKCNLPETMFADPGDEYKIELDGAEMRKSKPADFADYQVVFSNSDENVADVDDTGKITVKATGKTKINVTVFADGVAKTKTSQFYVGDVPSDAVIQKNFYKLTSGEEGSFDISVLKRFSREKVTEYDVTYESEDENVATVSADGTVRAVGEGKTNILFNITADGNTIKESVEVEVQNTLPEITGEIDLKAQSVNAENWIYDKNAKVTPGENKLSVATPGGSVGTAWLTGEKYENELVSFKASLDFSGSAWPAFILRAQTQNDCIGSKNTSYLIIFKEKEIEVQRFTNGGRFVFCGNINGFVPKVNYGIENKYIENAKQYDIKLGAIDVDEGVRLLCYVDGVKVVDVLDDTDGAITQSGYFGICDRVNAITFYGE